MSLVDIVRSDVLDDKEVADFVPAPSEHESVLAAGVAFPQNAVMAFHRSQPEIAWGRMTRQILKKSLGASTIIESEIFRGTLFVVLTILPACHW
jgi:hypothetical protein